MPTRPPPRAVAPEVLAAMLPYFGDAFGNASSVHARGEAAREAIEAARLEVARLIGAQSEEIVFTASGSEANNLALQGALAALPEGPRRRLVVSAVEHPSVLATARYLESRGFPLTVVPVRANGAVDPEALAEQLGPDVALVSVMAVNNETGVIQPVEEIGQSVHECGALFHVDAVQAIARLRVSVEPLAGRPAEPRGAQVPRTPGCGRAVRAPAHERDSAGARRHAGAGAARLAPRTFPRSSDSGAAAIRARTALDTGVPEAIAARGERLLALLLSRVPDTRLNGDLNQRVGGIVNVCFTGVDGEAVLHELDRAGVEVSTGSACSAAEPGPSHVLLAMGLEPEAAHASVRFSIGEGTTDEDVDRIGEITPPIVERLRSLAGPAMEQSA